MRIPEGKVEEIRAAADIVDVVSGFVRLKKAGRNFTGLCPFHQEKTPSFNVNPERGIFKCFGCGKGGNAFTFLMEIEKISFVEAAQGLAEKYHITIGDDPWMVRETTSSENLDALYEALKAAARFFYNQLNSDAGVMGQVYFKKRKWSEATQKKFGLGFAVESWDSLLRHATTLGISENILVETGLIIRKEGGHSYDRFRGRVMFPIFSLSKKVIGFGARAIRKEDEPKYLNSPETPIYVKSRVLYGLSHAVSSIRATDSVIIVEGYADVVSLHQSGLTNVVATSGTALTSEQVRTLARYTRSFLFLYDADSAGLNAMLRGLEVILEHDCDVRIVQLAHGEDPDSFVRKYGLEALQNQITKAVSFVDFIARRYKEEGKLDHPEGKTEAVRFIVRLIAQMDDRIRREIYIHHIAEQFGIYEKLLYDELDSVLKKKTNSSAHFLPARASDAEFQTPMKKPENPPRYELDFLRILLTAENDVQREGLQSIRMDYVTDPRLRSILHLVLEQYEHEGSLELSRLDLSLGEDVVLHSLYADLLMPEATVSERWNDIQTVRQIDERQVLLDAYKKMAISRLDAEKRKTLERIKFTGAEGAQTVLLVGDLQRLHELEDEIRKATSLHGISEIEIPEQHLHQQLGSSTVHT